MCIFTKLKASGTVLTAITSIQHILTTNASILISGTSAVESGTVVPAGTSVLAGIANATLWTCLTSFTVGTTWTHTEVVLEEVNTTSVV